MLYSHYDTSSRDESPGGLLPMGPSLEASSSWLWNVSRLGDRAPKPIPEAAAAATAGATVGADGVIVELGENASFSVYEPPPFKVQDTECRVRRETRL